MARRPDRLPDRHSVDLRAFAGHFCPKTPTGGFRKSGGTFTLAGSGDIAPYVTDVDPLGDAC